MFHDPSICFFVKKIPHLSAETTETPESVHPGLGAWTLANWRSSLQAYQNQTLQGADWSLVGSHTVGGWWEPWFLSIMSLFCFSQKKQFRKLEKGRAWVFWKTFGRYILFSVQNGSWQQGLNMFRSVEYVQKCPKFPILNDPILVRRNIIYNKIYLVCCANNLGTVSNNTQIAVLCPKPIIHLLRV